jgi:hypothetical protein
MSMNLFSKDSKKLPEDLTMQLTTQKRHTIFWLLSAWTALFFLSGCAQLDFSGKSDQDAARSATSTTSSSGSYYPTDFDDIMIPSALSWNRERSMAIRTASYAGGILNFSGRVDIDSLTDYFIATMPRDGWTLSGTIKYKNVLLAFTKANKTSLINIYSGELGLRTEVNIYVTEDPTGTHHVFR